VNTVISIQALRALAALSVVLVHYNEGYMIITGKGDYASLYPFGAGVDVFFVISGFVMLYSSEPLFGTSNAPFIFLRNRIARIVPLYWITTTIAIWPGWHFVPLKDIVDSYLFLPMKDPQGRFQPLYGVGWTLNFEMYFYVIFAACLLFSRKLVPILLVLLMIGAIIIGRTFQIHSSALIVWTDPIIIEFLLGVGIAMLFRNAIVLPLSVRIAMVAVSCATIWHFGPPAVPTGYRWAEWGIPAAAIMASAVLGTQKWSAGPLGSAAKTMGDASYSMYLLHILVLEELFRTKQTLGNTQAFVLLSACYALTIILSLFLYRYFERPMTDLLKAPHRKQLPTNAAIDHGQVPYR